MKVATTLLAGGVLGAGVLAGAHAAAADPVTIVVGNPANCPDQTYTNINDAVQQANPGDKIMVCPGIYSETVVVDKPDLTFVGGQAGIDARGKRSKATNTTVNYKTGGFTLTSDANDTTIDGFVISGAQGNNDGVADFAGASGLTLVNNVIQLNGNGVNLQNPDASMPALISQDVFINNNAGVPDEGQSGTGVFISNGPANNTQIVNDVFRQHSETAINFGGDPNNPSQNLVVSGNRSTDDSTFVVAGNSSGAIIEDNNIQTSAKAPGGSHGTGILDFGTNTSLRIDDNVMKATGTTMSSGVSVSNPTGTNSNYTTVTGNSISGWYNDLKIVSGNRNAYVAGNKLTAAQNDGILVQPDVSGVVLSRNTVVGATKFACEDQTTGSGTAGTANTWLNNHGSTASSPAGICTGPAS